VASIAVGLRKRALKRCESLDAPAGNAPVARTSSAAVIFTANIPALVIGSWVELARSRTWGKSAFGAPYLFDLLFVGVCLFFGTYLRPPVVKPQPAGLRRWPR